MATTGEKSRQDASRSPCCGLVEEVELLDTEAAALAVLFKALANPVRLQILDILSRHHGNICVCDIEGQFNLSQPTISHHLGVLRRAGLVTKEQRGLWVYYSLRPESLEKAEMFLEGLGGKGAVDPVSR